MENIFVVKMPFNSVTIAFYTLKEAQDYIRDEANKKDIEKFTMVDERIFKWFQVNGSIKFEQWAHIYECPLKGE